MTSLRIRLAGHIGDMVGSESVVSHLLLLVPAHVRGSDTMRVEYTRATYDKVSEMRLPDDVWPQRPAEWLEARIMHRGHKVFITVLGLLSLLAASRFFLAEWFGFAAVLLGTAWVFAVALLARRGTAAHGGVVQIVERGPQIITGDRLRAALLRLSQQRKQT